MGYIAKHDGEYEFSGATPWERATMGPSETAVLIDVGGGHVFPKEADK
jgi:hypothetical protein